MNPEDGRQRVIDEFRLNLLKQVEQKRIWYEMFDSLTKEQLVVFRKEMATAALLPEETFAQWANFTCGFISAILAKCHDTPMLSDEVVSDDALQAFLTAGIDPSI